MKKALKDYAQGPGEEPPVQEKTALLKLLDDAILEGVAFCRTKGILIDGLLESEDVFKKLDDFQRHADTLISKDEWRKGFAIHENTITSLFEACKPEVLGKAVVRKVAVFQYLRGIIDAIIEQQDLDAVSKKIGELLDASVVVDESHAPTLQEGKGKPAFAIIQRGKTWDLSKIDFEKLKAEFKQATYRNIEIADLRAFLDKKMEEMLKVNSTRKDFAQRLQEIINRYNAGGASNESYFDELVKFTKEMKAEDTIIIDLEGKTSIADQMIITSGRSNRHVGSIADEVVKTMKDAGHGSPRVEGVPHCDWVLIDCGDVIVHVFRPEVRQFYNLEKMWGVDRPTEATS
jgi:type I restriction enzyme R subunit